MSEGILKDNTRVSLMHTNKSRKAFETYTINVNNCCWLVARVFKVRKKNLPRFSLVKGLTSIV